MVGLRLLRGEHQETVIPWCLLQSMSTIACHLQGKFFGTTQVKAVPKS